MLDLKSADNKEWKQLEKKPVKRKTISTDIEKNTNKRTLKLIKKDTKQRQRNALKAQSSGHGGASFNQQVVKADLDSDLEFGSEGEGEYYNETD